MDVWGRKDEVDWRLPGAGAPCTSTARPGRWRSYPYLAELDGEDGEVLWSYLCHQWDRENNVEQFPDRKLIKFNFFMLQADVLPNMGFSATRKRLIHSHECVKSENAVAAEEILASPVESEAAPAEEEATSDATAKAADVADETIGGEQSTGSSEGEGGIDETVTDSGAEDEASSSNEPVETESAQDEAPNEANQEDGTTREEL